MKILWILNLKNICSNVGAHVSSLPAIKTEFLTNLKKIAITLKTKNVVQIMRITKMWSIKPISYKKYWQKLTEFKCRSSNVLAQMSIISNNLAQMSQSQMS